jgi:hypothetical protein
MSQRDDMTRTVQDSTQNTPADATRKISEPMERGLGNEPANSMIRTICLAAAGGAIAGSLAMQMMGRKHESLFIGQWAPTFIAIALWYQIVKSQQQQRGY